MRRERACLRAGVVDFLGVLMVTALGCSESEEKPHLPTAPQAMPNPMVGLVSLPLVEAHATYERKIFIKNGGLEDLVFSEPVLQGRDAAAFQVASTEPSDRRVASLADLSVAIIFRPTVRGVHLAELVLQSNAENLPEITYEIVGPAAAALSPGVPDLAPFQQEVPLDAAAGVAEVRFFNLGGAVLDVWAYTLADDANGAVSLQAGQLTPSAACDTFDPCGGSEIPPPECTSVKLGSGAYTGITLDYAPTGQDASHGILRITSNDPDTCQTDIILIAP